jgi:hypothetical protein
MAYCAPRGIPHSHFLGGPLQWTELDREKALWWLIHDRQRCPHCGTRPDEWDEKAGGDRHAYRAEPHHCRGCEVKAGADEDFEKHRKEYPRGSSVRLMKNTGDNPDDEE